VQLRRARVVFYEDPPLHEIETSTDENLDVSRVVEESIV
jgi:hypothetical protein